MVAGRKAEEIADCSWRGGIGSGTLSGVDEGAPVSMKMDPRRATCSFLIASAMPGLVALVFPAPPGYSQDFVLVALMLVLWYLFSLPVVSSVGIFSIMVSSRFPRCRWVLPPALGLGGGYLIAISMYTGGPPLEMKIKLAVGGLAAGVTAAFIYYWPILRGSPFSTGTKE